MFCRAPPSLWLVLGCRSMCMDRGSAVLVSLLGCLLPPFSFSVHSHCWVRQGFPKVHLSRR